MIIVILILNLLTSNKANASCNAESKDLDACLQCCTDTSQAANAIKKKPKLAKDLKTICPPNDLYPVNLASEEARQINSEYGISATALFVACENKDVLGSRSGPLNAYATCVSKCGSKFGVKKK